MSAVGLVIDHYRGHLPGQPCSYVREVVADLLDLIDAARKYDAEAAALRVLRDPEPPTSFDWSALEGDKLKKWGSDK